MNDVTEVLAALKAKGTEQTRKTFLRHGIPDNMFGVKVADLKLIAKAIKGQQDLAYELYRTQNYDAMYLAGMIADGATMPKRELEYWCKHANCSMIAEYPIAWVASESKHGPALANKWMRSKQPQIACSGWATQAALVATKPDSELDLSKLADLLKELTREIHSAPNRVRYTMNGFVIAVGSYVKPLHQQARTAAKKIGTVEVEMGATACKVPLAIEYIDKIAKLGRIGKKRKTARC